MSILVIASSLYHTIATPDPVSFSMVWTFVVTDFLRGLGIVASFYGELPAVHVQLSHFFTTKLVYVVSNKPMRAKNEA
jgi:hypothetical protein